MDNKSHSWPSVATQLYNINLENEKVILFMSLSRESHILGIVHDFKQTGGKPGANAFATGLLH